MMVAPASTASTRCGSANTSRKKSMPWICGNTNHAQSSETTTPRNIAMPPSRGTGVRCTSRSRTCGYHLYLTPAFQSTQLTRKLTTAEIAPASR